MWLHWQIYVPPAWVSHTHGSIRRIQSVTLSPSAIHFSAYSLAYSSLILLFFNLTISVSCIFYWILTIIYLIISFNKWWIFYCFIRVACMFVCVGFFFFLIYCFWGFFRFRMWCQKVISHRLFDHIVLVFIFLNCITIALERPDIKNDSTVRHTRTANTHQNCFI